MKATLVKWDAALVGEHPPTHLADPSSHPGCIEVIALDEGQPPVILYRREDHATDDNGRTVPR